MFSGIIEQVGRIEWVQALPAGKEAGLRMKVYCDPDGWSHPAAALRQAPMIGESIAVDGVCLTAVAWHEDGFLADLSPETLQVAKPYFHPQDNGSPRARSEVNLERAMRYGQLVGGHLVSGHVDGMGTVAAILDRDDFSKFNINVPQSIINAIVRKGCIAINGISLTVNDVSDEGFSVMIIPHTLAHTNLQGLTVGAAVNLETDLMAKYVMKSTAAKCA